MTIRLITLGGLRAVDADGELDWLAGQRVRAALLVHVAVEGRVRRASLATILWPDSDEEHARSALRQSLYHLRRVLGADVVQALAHDLRAGPRVRTDVGDFAAALERGAPESAARLYAGPFLDGIHLVDVPLWERWVDGKRGELARGFRTACRDWLESRRSAGDLDGALEAALAWAAPDPGDDEAQHQLIRTLVDAGEAAEAIRQYETYARMLELEGLRPLDETAALIERARSRPTPWPEPAEEPDEPATPAPAATAMTPSTGRQVATGRPRLGLLVAALGLAVTLLTAFWLVQPHWTPDTHVTLVADGVIEEGERIVIADFGGPPTDPALGVVVTDALRFDLLATPSLRPADRSEVSEIMARMQVATNGPLTADLAREVALRGGFKALLEGEIAQVGTGYVLTAALRSTEPDRVLAGFRETAASPDDVIPAIDRLSRQIRRRAGESLRAVDAASALEQVTTASLDALRAYSQATRALERQDYHRTTSLLEEALELDPEFAMAWRLLAIALGNTRADREREVHAAARAYELRHRLSRRERQLAVAGYHDRITGDHQTAVQAYRQLLELDPDDPVALNNLGLILMRLGDFETAAALLAKASDGPDPSPIASLNLVHALLAAVRLEEARVAAEALAGRYPDHRAAADATFWTRLRLGDETGARAPLDAMLADVARSPPDRAMAHDRLARLALERGRIEEARGHLEAAERIIRDAGAPYDPFDRRLSRAHAEVVIGDPDRGVQLLREALEEPGSDGQSPSEGHHAFQATIYAMAGRADDAEAALRRAEAAVPAALRDRGREPAGIGRARALIHLLRGDASEAVAALERVRAAEPCRYCFAMPMGWALREAGRPDEAAREWENAVAGRDTFDDLGIQSAERLWTRQRLPTLLEELGAPAAARRY